MGGAEKQLSRSAQRPGLSKPRAPFFSTSRRRQGRQSVNAWPTGGLAAARPPRLSPQHCGCHGSPLGVQPRNAASHVCVAESCDRGTSIPGVSGVCLQGSLGGDVGVAFR